MKQSTEQRKIASLARQYQSEGYEVVTEPRNSTLSPLLGNYQPDLVVRKGDEVIIIEVVSSKTAKEKRAAIEQLARYAHGQKGIRFDLVVTNIRRTRQGKQNRDSKLLKLLRESMLREIGAMVQSNPTASMILCSVLVENLLRGLVGDDPGLLERDISMLELADWLGHRGTISRSAQTFVTELSTARNTVLHDADRASVASASDFYQKTKSLLRNYKRESGP